MLPIKNISYLLPMCCSFWEKCNNSPKTDLGCSTPLKIFLFVFGIYRQYVYNIIVIQLRILNCMQIQNFNDIMSDPPC